MSITSRRRTLPEDLLSIVCDHYADERQLRALSTICQLNQRTSSYARTRLYRHFDFIDDRSSRVLENANDLCAEYEDSELLDEHILSAIDCREIDPLDLDPPLRWLKGMRTCESMEIKDLLYGRDMESLLTLANSLSERDLVLFPKVKQITISAKIVKRILATEAKGPRPKQTPLDLLITLFQATRPKRLCIQDSAIFTPPSRQVWSINRLGRVAGRAVPFRGGHMSTTMIQWIQEMLELDEIRYHQVNPDIPIYPKKGIRHVVSFISDPKSSSLRPTYTDKLIREIKDIITRSVVGSPRFVQPPRPSGPSGDTSPSTNTDSGPFFGNAVAGPSTGRGGTLFGSGATSTLFQPDGHLLHPTPTDNLPNTSTPSNSSASTSTTPTLSRNILSTYTNTPTATNHHAHFETQHPDLFGSNGQIQLPGGSTIPTPGIGREVDDGDESLPIYKQSSWHFSIPGRREMEVVKKEIMDWAEGFECGLGNAIREGISFGVKEEEGGCRCCGP